MLSIGQRMNDFIVSAVCTQWRADRPDGAVILGVRQDEDGSREYVTAVLPQHEIDRPEPAESWAWGHYFDSGTNKNAAADALQDWAERAGVGSVKAGPAVAISGTDSADLRDEMRNRACDILFDSIGECPNKSDATVGEDPGACMEIADAFADIAERFLERGSSTGLHR